MTGSPIFQLHAIVTGHVQGVGFRNYVSDRANFLGLTGWVRNTYAGDVEVCVEGQRGDLDVLLQALRKGPRGAMVVDVIEKWEQPSGQFSRFQIVSTA